MFADSRGTYSHHGWSQASSIMSAHTNLERDAPKQFLLVATGQLQHIYNWVGVGGTGESSPFRMGIQ